VLRPPADIAGKDIALPLLTILVGPDPDSQLVRS
jgi:hypothetical protein